MKKYKLKVVNGYVSFIREAGKDLVKNTMPIENAERIMKKGRIKKSDYPDYIINVDDEWFFEGIPYEEEVKEEATEE